MAVCINFLHERDARRKQAKRDPRKFAVLGSIILVLLMATFYMHKRDRMEQMRTRHAAVAARYAEIRPGLERYESEKAELEGVITFRDHLRDRVEARFLWAPVLAALARSTPAEIQILSLSSTSKPAPPVLEVEGLATGTSAHASADRLRKSLIDLLSSRYGPVGAGFIKLEEAEPVSINGREVPVATFVIRLEFGPAALHLAQG